MISASALWGLLLTPGVLQEWISNAVLREVVSGEFVSKDGLLQGQIKGFRSVYASAVLELLMEATPAPETLQLDLVRIRTAQAEFMAIVDRVAVLTYASNSIGLFNQCSIKEKRTVSFVVFRAECMCV